MPYHNMVYVCIYFIILAIQMWTLARFLPLCIGHLVPEDNELWRNFLHLLEITDILFETFITKEDCGYLESIIIPVLDSYIPV